MKLKSLALTALLAVSGLVMFGAEKAEAQRARNLPPGYTYCAKEGQQCQIPPGAVEVAYGAEGVNYNFATFRGPQAVLCDNSLLGDPAKGYKKRCYYRQVHSGGHPGGGGGWGPPPGPGPGPAPGPRWQHCAREGELCYVGRGEATVRYGVGRAWRQLNVHSQVACTNQVFGDPAPGYRKTCQVYR